MLNKLTHRVYYMDYVQQGDRPVLGLVVGEKYSLVIDGGNSKAHAEEFLSYVKKLNIPELKYLVLTHHHWDHVFGMKTMNLTNIVHKNTNEKLEWMKSLEWSDKAIFERVKRNEEIEFCEEHIKIEHPKNSRVIEIVTGDIIFENRIEIDLGGVSVKVEHIDADHSNDCCLVNIDSEKVTFMGDAMYLDMYNGPWSYTREKLYPLLDKLMTYDSKFYIPAHHNKYSNEGFKSFVKYIREIGEIVGENIELDKSINEVKKIKNVTELSQFEIEDVQGFVAGNIKRSI